MSKKKLDFLGVSAFCESMGMMVQAGIQTDEAVALLQSESKDGGVLEQGLEKMKGLLEQGESLAAAMRESEIFPDYAVRMIEAGESSGRLEDVLFRLGRYYAEQKLISEKLRGAVTYPAAMLVLIIAVLVVMLTTVLPSFRDVYNNLTGSLSSSSYAYIRWAWVFCWVALIVMVLAAVCLVAGLLLWKSGKRPVVEKLLKKFPSIGALLDSTALFRFTGAVNTFLSSGEMQDEAVLSSIPMTDSADMEEKLRRCVQRMEEGHSLAQAAYDEELFEPVYGRMLLSGERSGGLEHVLERLNLLQEQSISARVDHIVEIVGPVLSGVLMVTVGLTLISVMLPLIGMMNSVG